MVVLGHSRGLIVLGVISDSPTGFDSVFALLFDVVPPLLQSLVVIPEVLRRPLVFLQVLVPAENLQSVLDGDLEVPRNVGYAICSSRIEDSEVSGLTGGTDDSDPAAAPCEFFASAPSLMNGRRASLIFSRTGSG